MFIAYGFIAITAAALASFSLVKGLFPLFCLAAFLMGWSGAAGHQYRFAAVEAVPGRLAPDILLEMTGRYQFSRPKTRFSNNGRRVAFEVAVDTGRQAAALVGQTVVITVVDGPASVEHRAVVAKGF